MVRRLKGADMVVCASALLLIVSLFMRWWALPDQGLAAQVVDQPGVVRSVSGFGADVLLVPVAGLCALAALWLPLIGTDGEARGWRDRLLPVVGCVPLGVVALEWFSPPNMLPGEVLGSAVGGLIGVSPKPQLGLALALIASLVLVVAVAVSEGVLSRVALGLGKARAAGASGAIWASVSGTVAVLLALLGCLTHDWGALIVSIGTAVATLFVARGARRHAHQGDTDVGYLIRFGQVGGWIVVGTFAGTVALGLIIAGGS